MRSSTKVLSLVISLLFTITMLQPICIWADDVNTSNAVDTTVQSKITQINNKIALLNSNISVSVSNYSELKTAIDNEAKNICLTDNIQLEDTLLIGYDICFNSNLGQKTIYSSEESRHIEITDSGILISFNGIILDGTCEDKSDSSGGIDIPFKDIEIVGAVLQNCSNSWGSAIVNEPQNNLGSFTMYNCRIHNNSGDTSVYSCSDESLIYGCTVEKNTSGGLSLGPEDENQHGSIIIYNSIIKDNSYYDGAGLLLLCSDVYLNDNTVIENNTADKGGGIYILGCSLENHADIKNNTAEEGGGIYANESKIINYSEIDNNSTTYCGGGGILLENSTFVMEAGEIAYNAAGVRGSSVQCCGGGICILYTSGENDVVINNGIIKNNTAVFGGGIGYNYSNSFYQKPAVPKVIINNGTISSNGYKIDEDDGTVSVITNEGGGIFGCYVKMTGGIIEKNIARYGAGIKTLDFIMEGGTIKDNGYYEDDNGTITLFNYSGAGIYTYGSTTISGGTISSNRAEQGAGLYVVKNLTLTAPARVQNNTASDVGGGIYFYHLANRNNTNMDCVINNTSVNDGDQYFIF